MKKTTWEKIYTKIISVASALVGVLSAHAMTGVR